MQGYWEEKLFSCPRSSQNKADLSQTQKWSVNPAESLCLTSVRDLGLVWSRFPTFQGEVGGEGLKLPLFDTVPLTGTVFHHAILFSRIVTSSLSPWVSTHTCVSKATREGRIRKRGSKKETPLKLNILYQGMKPWHSVADTILQQNCSKEVAKIREPQASKQLNK